MGGVADFFEGPVRDFVFGKDNPTTYQQKTVTLEERNRLLAEFDKTGGKSVTGDIYLGMNQDEVKTALAKYRQAYADSLIVPPTPPPDAGEIAVRKAAGAERLKQAAAGGAGATFLTGPAGLPTFKGLKPMAGGY